MVYRGSAQNDDENPESGLLGLVHFCARETFNHQLSMPNKTVCPLFCVCFVLFLPVPEYAFVAAAGFPDAGFAAP